MRRVGAVVIGVILGLILGVENSRAAPASVVIDDRSATLAEQAGGGWTASLGFTNLSDGDLTVVPAAADPADVGCKPTVDEPTLAAAQHSAIEVKIPPGCNVADDGIDLRITVSAPDAIVTSFDVTAAPKPDLTKPEWGALRAFPIALLVLMIGAGLFFILWQDFDDLSHKFTQRLEYLDKAWSFKESWVGNITVAAGLLTGIFGSSAVVKALLGKDAEKSIALAIVGAAIAAAFIAAGPIILLSTKSKGFVTVGGLLLASAFTLTGAFGELWIVYRSGSHLDLGGWQDHLVIALVVASGLLLLYAVRSILETLEVGTTPPDIVQKPETVVAATMITESLKSVPGVDAAEVERAIARVIEEPPAVAAGTSSAAGYRLRRSASL
jgi:hypothetical protein